MKGIVSSHMPNTDPAMENTSISTGMMKGCRRGRRENAAAILLMARLMAPLSLITLKAPPMMNRKTMISMPSWKPRIGDSRSASSPAGRWATRWKVPGTVTRRLLPPTLVSTRWNSPEGMTQVRTTIMITRT